MSKYKVTVEEVKENLNAEELKTVYEQYFDELDLKQFVAWLNA